MPQEVKGKLLSVPLMACENFAMEPLDSDETGYQVWYDGKRIGKVLRNLAMPFPLWEMVEPHRPRPHGVFDRAEVAAQQVTANYLERKGGVRNKGRAGA